VRVSSALISHVKQIGGLLDEKTVSMQEMAMLRS
jgi:hypothetical protein